MSSEQAILDQIGVPLRAQPGRVCVVPVIPTCDFCEQKGIFDFATRMGAWANGCLVHFNAHSLSPKLGVGSGQLWITKEQVGLTRLPRG